MLKYVTCAGAANVANSYEATMPKLEPAPRSAQNRSGLSFALQRAMVPFARTTVMPMIQSVARPYLWELMPYPPCREWPLTPTLLLR
jgi:hypothetical protein